MELERQNEGRSDMILPRERLPKKAVEEKDLMCKRSLYNLLKKTYFLPKYSSNACTRDRLQRLFDNKYMGFRADKVVSTAKRFDLPISVLHESVCILIEHTQGKKLFHHDTYGNYRYYLHILYHAFPNNYKTLFQASMHKTVHYTIPLSRNISSLKFSRLMTTACESDLLTRKNAEELMIMQNTIRLVDDEQPVEIKLKITQAWLLVAKLNRIAKAMKKLRDEVQEMESKVFVQDEEVNTRLLNEMKSIIHERICRDLHTYGLSKNVIMSDCDIKIHFKQRINTSVDANVGVLNTHFEPSIAERYFDAVLLAPPEQFESYLTLFDQKYKCGREWSEWSRKIIELIPPYIQGMFRFKLLCCSTRATNFSFWNKIFSIALLPQGEVVFSKMTMENIHNLPGVLENDLDQFVTYCINASRKRLARDSSITSLCLERINSSAVNFFKCFFTRLNEVPVPLQKPFERAMCDFKANFAVDALTDLVIEFVYLITGSRFPLEYSDVDTITGNVIRNEALSSIESMRPFHIKCTNFKNVILSFDIPAFVAKSAASLYPTSSCLNALKTNKVFLHNYLIAVISSVTQLNQEDDIGTLSQLVYNFLRMGDFSTGYLSFMLQVATVYQLSDIKSHNLAAAIISLIEGGLSVSPKRMRSVFLVTHQQEIMNRCKSVIDAAKGVVAQNQDPRDGFETPVGFSSVAAAVFSSFRKRLGM